eukprot:5348389-Amphidinium_carterae.1
MALCFPSHGWLSSRESRASVPVGSMCSMTEEARAARRYPRRPALRQPCNSVDSLLPWRSKGCELNPHELVTQVSERQRCNDHGKAK